jgi:hypothetical protein
MWYEWGQGAVTQLVHSARLPHSVDSLPLPLFPLCRSSPTSFSLRPLVAYSSLPRWTLAPPISAAAYMRRGSDPCIPTIE